MDHNRIWFSDLQDQHHDLNAWVCEDSDSDFMEAHRDKEVFDGFTDIM